MKSDIKQKWIDALRSGKYRQALGSLKEGSNKYCCLGVLCDIYINETKAAQWNHNNRVEWGNIERSGQLLPDTIAEWAGIENPMSTPTVSVYIKDNVRKAYYRAKYGISDRFEPHLANINDLGTSFSEIADIIEKEL